MVDWHPGARVPDQLGDAFAALYDWFKPRHSEDADNHRWDDDLLGSKDGRTYAMLKRSVEQAGAKTPAFLARYIDETQSEQTGLGVARAVFFCLCAIDMGIQRQSPLETASPDPGDDLGLLDHYRRHFRFNTDATSGYVLPKWTGTRFRGHSSAVEEHFANLVRASVDRDRVRVLGRAGRSRRRRWEETENPGIAVVPTLYEFFSRGSVTAEASFSGVVVGDDHCFKLDHNPMALAGLRERVEESVHAIHRSGATIAVFPELVLNQELLGSLRASLLSASRIPAFRRSNLDWVMAGVGLPTESGAKWPVVNACYVLDRFGHTISTPLASGEETSWIQEKRYRYKLSTGEQEKYGIDSCFPDCVDREEAIRRGKHLYVFEDRGRRFAVLICEDLAEERHTLEVVREMGCSALITIVMDGSVEDHRWSSTRARGFAERTGALALVANSLLLPNIEKVREKRLAEKRDEPYPHGEKPVGLMFIPNADAAPIVKRLEARATPMSGNWKSLISNVCEIPLVCEAPLSSLQLRPHH